MPKLTTKRGFTLIELLVVVAILGILVTISIAAFGGAQQKGRDSRRKSDLDALKKALELAKGDSTSSAYYPGCTTASPCLLPTIALLPALETTYIKKVPQDPSGGGSCTLGLAYCYDSLVTRGGATCTTSYCAGAYNLTACLENSTEPVGGNVTLVASTRCASTKLYTVTEP
ncbi:hypothetical protein A2W45_02955 [Candidatus Curtissbacteria bacterium RIFCSPHIGHO2_12_41_11]|uniref:Type II secretion system protein GspG C-terminal domain-containing protein n=3 Tax=Candidatus Curtissiibacteriota TaxID=1752717 RepID=A0A1F5HQB7_9BACT|nr:MAG: General secretion pathway protein G [Candidatus Curtissbacteria bacterium GW2011_GWA2_41_24]OGD99019.1 MAG: hypothetical protein A2W45_02955 [Candidatus Curtissbacteria bacterium RIFCSPHIGHO2_12_41_11]OGE06273.1 MAG: hypothetical protein A2W70_00360 [Candidatus Curtissbacteria bacterium RIFCSPLOWO2_02_41_11]